MQRKNLEDLLLKHEGMMNKPYFCSSGKLTIGIGRNIEDNGITKDEAVILLKNDIERCEQEARKYFPWFDSLGLARQDVILSMIFNLGITRLLGFKNLISAIAKQDFKLAAEEMLASLWAKQVKARASELSEMMKTGQYKSN